MPQTTKKAKLLSQLRDLWLANSILTNLVGEDDFDLLKGILFASRGQEHVFDRGVSMGVQLSSVGFLGGGGEGGVEVSSWLLLHSGEEKIIEGEVMGTNWENMGNILDAEVVKAIEILLLGIPRIRDLAARQPIPHSEYLFNYHVCILMRAEK